ncbi:MAG: hypothetical protein [Circular genetic element sp.]|nr:MAG: hypothetical protein [Circular genetic element sp.]
MASSNIASTTRKLYITFSDNTGEQYVDLAQCLSLVNRRAYRQGMNYAIDNIRLYATSGGNVNCSIVPTTWCADNATTRAFIAWSAQRKEVLDEQPSMKSRWSDFKIFMDSDHVTATVAANLLPNGINPLLNPGEWVPSEIVFPVDGGAGGTPAANQQTMHVCGDNLPIGNFQTATGTSFSLIEAYANSRRTHEDPDPSTTGVSTTTNPYATLSVPDSLFQDVAENLLDNNNSPPYPNDEYPGGATYLAAPQIFAAANLNNIGDSAAYSTFNTGPFVAPFGLLKFDPVSFDLEATIFLEITLVPGSYKGVLAEKGV